MSAAAADYGAGTWELTKTFRFEAAHTLERAIDRDASLRVHGHSYRATVTVAGEPDASTGMLVDLAVFERGLASARDGLDHRLLDEIDGLGPATMENLCVWIWHRLAPTLPGLHRVEVHRDSQGDRCSYMGPR